MNVKERERQAEELFQLAVEDGRTNRGKNVLPLWGPDDSFHFNPMLLQNIKHSPYFQKCCAEIRDWNALVDEIYYQVQHLEPWAVGALDKSWNRKGERERLPGCSDYFTICMQFSHECSLLFFAGGV